ncbi:MAG: hypothetical protein A3J79_12335 [Elusimicrobia bacterium RIFOXYB2_FULL_62_6]|nr:MAG: hypothetical protein A3J79_12335 [Elusimicrobia bacterium RIFOXYB2_FULL_62_6]
MDIFWRFFLSHLLADFTLQFNIINKLKRQGVFGMILHCLTHYIVAVALLYNQMTRIWVDVGFLQLNGWWAVTVMLVLHFIIDELRVYSVKKLGFRDGTASFLLDQFLHVYVMFMLSPVTVLDKAFFLPEKWVGILCMFILVTHVTTVLVYFIEKELHGKEFPGFDEKYFLIFERIVLWSFFFVSGWWWLPFAGAWIMQLFYIKKKRIIDLSGTNILISLAVTIVCGLWTRIMYLGSIF